MCIHPYTLYIIYTISITEVRYKNESESPRPATLPSSLSARWIPGLSSNSHCLLGKSAARDRNTSPVPWAEQRSWWGNAGAADPESSEETAPPSSTLRERCKRKSPLRLRPSHRTKPRARVAAAARAVSQAAASRKRLLLP